MKAFSCMTNSSSSLLYLFRDETTLKSLLKDPDASPHDAAAPKEYDDSTLLFNDVESVRSIFKKHPLALGFRPKNQNITRAYMIELDNFLEAVCQSSEDDMSNANDTLVDLIHVGFKFDWLKTKLSQVSGLDWAIMNLPAFQSDAFVIGGCKCHHTLGNLDASEKSEKDGAESNHLLSKSSSVMETLDANGFQVLPSKEESVRRGHCNRIPWKEPTSKEGTHEFPARDAVSVA